MATIEFGLGKAYDWSYFKSKTGIKSVNQSDFGVMDGWLTLDSITPYASQPFDNFTGWTESNTGGGDCTIDPAGVAKIKASSTDTSQAIVYKDGFGNASGDTTFAVDMLIKLTVLPTKTEVQNANYPRAAIVYNDGTNQFYFGFCTDGTKLVLHWYTGAGFSHNFYDTGLTKDSRIHNVIFRNNNGTSADFILDGAILTTFARRAAHSTQKGYFNPECIKYGTNIPELSLDYVNVIGAFLNYETSQKTIGQLEQSAGTAGWDLGSGKRTAKVYFTVDVSNSTAATVQIQTAANSAGLSSASWETIAASGDSVVTKGRWFNLQVLVDDASSGQFTPIVKYVGVEDEDGAVEFFSPLPSHFVV